MNLDFPGIASDFDDVPLGGFFMFKRTVPEFGLCVSVGQMKSAIIFSRSEKLGVPLWLAAGGLPNDALVRLPRATLRAELSSIVEDDRQALSGAVVSAGGKFYLRARQSISSYFTFNLQTGAMEDPPYAAKSIAFSRWQVGLPSERGFDLIFSFPVSAN